MKFLTTVATTAFLGLVALPASATPIGGQADPKVAAANDRVSGQVAAQSTVNADVQTGYAEDMARYRAALRAHHRTATRDQRVYDRQQRAYADAMADWRRQVYACKHGSRRACNAPTPDPAAYW